MESEKMKPPQYVKCKQVWCGSAGNSIMGHVYDTSIHPDFSQHTWEKIYERLWSDPILYFDPATEEDWNIQQGIPVVRNNYELYG